MRKCGTTAGSLLQAALTLARGEGGVLRKKNNVISCPQ